MVARSETTRRREPEIMSRSYTSIRRKNSQNIQVVPYFIETISIMDTGQAFGGYENTDITHACSGVGL
jgi:hypothetical protein